MREREGGGAGAAREGSAREDDDLGVENGCSSNCATTNADPAVE
jgi:hypothetical protein